MNIKAIIVSLVLGSSSLAMASPGATGTVASRESYGGAPGARDRGVEQEWRQPGARGNGFQGERRAPIASRRGHERSSDRRAGWEGGRDRGERHGRGERRERQERGDRRDRGDRR